MSCGLEIDNVCFSPCAFSRVIFSKKELYSYWLLGPLINRLSSWKLDELTLSPETQSSDSGLEVHGLGDLRAYNFVCRNCCVQLFLYIYILYTWRSARNLSKWYLELKRILTNIKACVFFFARNSIYNQIPYKNRPCFFIWNTEIPQKALKVPEIKVILL